MTIEIKVGPPVITISQGRTFMVTDKSGSITADNDMDRTYRQVIDDMGALRIYDMDVSDEAWVPAAGVPWFVTLFGRDSLTVSYQNMTVSAGFARGALKCLAAYQATERSDWHDAQPGKIMHEIRGPLLNHPPLLARRRYFTVGSA